MEQLNVYYVNLSDRRPDQKTLQSMRDVETSQIPEPAKKPQNLYKYFYRSAATGGETFSPVYGSQTNEANLKKLMEYYPAFKILRNNSNHANGIGGKNEQIVCRRLRDEGILHLSDDQFGDDTISLDYTAEDHLFRDAIAFHEDLI